MRPESWTQLFEENLSKVPSPDKDVEEYIIGDKSFKIQQGCLVTYNGNHVAIRVGLFDNNLNLTIFSAEDWVKFIKETTSYFEPIIVSYISSCPVVPSPPLTYSNSQLNIEQNQILVFRNTDGYIVRVRFGETSKRISPNIIINDKEKEILSTISMNPTENDLMFTRLRPYIDYTHVPNIAEGRFNGLDSNGKSVIGESNDPKWGKRVRLLTSPIVKSTLTEEKEKLLQIAVFQVSKDEKNNPLDNIALYKYNYKKDKIRWQQFIGEFVHHPLYEKELRDLYFAAAAGCLIGNPTTHYVQTINKQTDELFWRMASTGDKITGIGKAFINNKEENAIIKGTVLIYDFLDNNKIDFITIDAYKGSSQVESKSNIDYSFTTEYMASNSHKVSLPITMFLYNNIDYSLEDFQNILLGNDTKTVIDSLTFLDEKGNKVFKKAADVLKISNTAFFTSAAWENGVDTHLLSIMKDHLTPKYLGLWKVLSSTINEEFDSVFVPVDDIYNIRKKLVDELSIQLKIDKRTIYKNIYRMNRDEFATFFEENNIRVNFLTVPMIPGVHCNCRIKLWKHNSIGISPELAVNLTRDNDGDYGCIIFSNELLEKSSPPKSVLAMMFSAIKVADRMRKTISTPFSGDSLTLGYKGAKRSLFVGKSHHLVHYNFFRFKDLSKNNIPDTTLSSYNLNSLKSKFGTTGVFAYLYHLLQHQAIGEISYCNKGYIEELLENIETTNIIMPEDMALINYPQYFSSLSTSKMSGSLINFIETALNTKPIEIEDNSNLIHKKILDSITKLGFPKFLTDSHGEIIAELLGYDYKQNKEAWNAVNQHALPRLENETWYNYFYRKADLVVLAKIEDEVVPHLLTRLSYSNLDSIGLLLSILDRKKQLNNFNSITKSLLLETTQT